MRESLVAGLCVYYVESENECMKTPVPDTRHSLILRLTDRRDAEAWDQFVSIYEPLVFRLARSKGFQDADAREISQEVLIAVSSAVERWQPDAELGRFRDWLFRIARNLMINFMTRRHHQSIASGDSHIAELLDQQFDPNSVETAEFEFEYRREVFRLAAEQVRRQVKDATWQAFWLTSTEQKSVAEVASQLSISIGAVHIARSRVRASLRKWVAEWEQNGGVWF